MEDKPLEEKNIIEKYTKDGQVKVGLCLLELEKINKDQELRITALEEAMAFFSKWYNDTQRVDILVPDTLKNELDNNGPKIIL